MRPSRQASNAARRLVVRASARTRAAGTAGRCPGGATARRRRSPARPARCGSVSAPGDRRAQVGQQRARVDLAVLQVRRQPRGAVQVGPVAVGAVVVQRVGHEALPALAGGLLADVRQLDAGQVRLVRQALRRPPTSPAQPAGGGPAGAGQPRSRQARKNGVNTWYGVPSALVTEPGPTAYGDPVRTSGRPAAASAASARSSRSRPYGPASALTCTGARRARRPPPGRRPPGRPRAPPGRRRTRASNAASERTSQARRGAPAGPSSAGRGRTAAAPGRRRRGRRVQGRVVVQAQVAAQPQDGVGHDVDPRPGAAARTARPGAPAATA